MSNPTCPIERGGCGQVEIQAPLGVSGFDLALAVVKVLERDHGGVVTDVDVDEGGLQLRLRIGDHEPRWRRDGRRRTIIIRERWERSRVIQAQCHSTREVVARQRTEIIRRREWLESRAVR